jgi:sugar phosphate isomerase/epimerase
MNGQIRRRDLIRIRDLQQIDFLRRYGASELIHAIGEVLLQNIIREGLRPRGRWSHDYRPMPYGGGYLPIEDVAKAVLKTGFRGWFSMEIFDGGPEGKGRKYELEAYAKRAMQSMLQVLVTFT